MVSILHETLKVRAVKTSRDHCHSYNPCSQRLLRATRVKSNFGPVEQGSHINFYLLKSSQIFAQPFVLIHTRIPFLSLGYKWLFQYNRERNSLARSIVTFYTLHLKRVIQTAKAFLCSLLYNIIEISFA